MSKPKDIWLVKRPDKLFMPFQTSDYEIAQWIKEGEETCFTLKHIRVPAFHRKYFALIKLGFENQDYYKDEYVFRKIMEMRAGYFIPVKTERGNEVALPDSIAYERLDQEEFEKLYDRVYAEIENMLGLVKDEDREMFQNELAQFA